MDQAVPPIDEAILVDVWRWLNQTFEGMAIVDASGRILCANPALCAMSGYQPEELVGREIELLVPEAQRGSHAVYRQGLSLHTTRRPMGLGRELDLRCADGSSIPVEIGLTAVETTGGWVTLAFVVDIRTRRQLERRTLDAAVAAETDRVIRQGVLALAHHVRNSLGAILGRAELFDGSNLDRARVLKQVVLEQGERIAAVIDVISELTRGGVTVASLPTGTGGGDMLDLDPLIEQHLARRQRRADA